MIGNDIIDLHYAKHQSNWQRRGFLEKLFTEPERVLIHNTADPEKAVWLLWSMKESTYKIIARQKQRTFYAPKIFLCSIQETADFEKPLIGTVSYKKDRIVTQSHIHPDHIHTFAWTSHNQIPRQFTTKLTSLDHLHQSKYTYERLLEEFAQFYHLKKQHLSIQKNKQGIPQIVHQGKTMPQHISISHHGRFGGFAF